MGLGRGFCHQGGGCMLIIELVEGKLAWIAYSISSILWGWICCKNVKITFLSHEREALYVFLDFLIVNLSIICFPSGPTRHHGMFCAQSDRGESDKLPHLQRQYTYTEQLKLCEE